MTRQLVPFVLCLFFIACGPNEAELRQAQQEHDDSVRIATENRMAAKHSLEMSIRDIETTLESYNNRLKYEQIELEVSKDELGRIKQWQLGRLPEEREQQIRNQLLIIQDAEESISNLLSDINAKEVQLQTTQLQLQEYQ